MDILSSTFDNNYSYFNGTSMATPHVAGAAALLLSNQPAYTAGQLKNALLNSVEKPSSLDELWPIFASGSPNGQNTLTSGRLNVFNSLSASTANNFPVSDGDINGAIPIVQTKTGSLNFPADDSVEREVSRGRTAIMQAALDTLAHEQSPAAAIVRKSYAAARTVAEDAARPQASTELDQLRLAAIDAQRRELEQLRKSDEISDEAYRRLQEEIDWAELDAAPAGHFQPLATDDPTRRD